MDFLITIELIMRSSRGFPIGILRQVWYLIVSISDLCTLTYFNPGSILLRKTIEGYLDSVPSLTFNTIKTLLIMHAFHSSRHLQSKWMLYFSHA